MRLKRPILFSAVVLCLLQLHSLRYADSADVVCGVTYVGLSAYSSPTMEPSGFFKRYFPYKQAYDSQEKKESLGFVMLEPLDPKIPTPKQKDPELRISNLAFDSSYVLVSPGQTLTIINDSIHHLTFNVFFGDDPRQIKIEKGGRGSIDIIGLKEGTIECDEFPHIKAYILRAGSGFVAPVVSRKGNRVKIIFNGVPNGPYKLRLWYGRWWEINKIDVSTNPYTLRMDVDLMGKSDSIEYVANPPEDDIKSFGKEKDDAAAEQPKDFKQEKQNVEPMLAPIDLKGGGEYKIPSEEPKEKKKLEIRMKSTKEEKKEEKKPEKKVEKKPDKKEEKKPSGGGLFKIKKIEE